MKSDQRTPFQRTWRWGAVVLFGGGYSVLAHLAAASATPDRLDALVAVAPLLGLAFLMAWRSSRRALMLGLCLAACAGLWAASAWLVAHSSWIFLLQHAGMYALLCLAFGRTLARGQTPMVTGFARIVHGTLSPALIAYTRAVTLAWSIYFASMVAVSLLLFWLAPIEAWSAFANLLGFPLLALMFAGEYAVRCWVLPAQDRAGPLESIRAYRQASSGRTTRRP